MCKSKLVGFLVIALVMSDLMLVAGMYKYKVPKQLWPAKDQKWIDAQKTFPKIEFSKAYTPNHLPPKLGFHEAIKSEPQLKAWQESARQKLSELFNISLPQAAPSVRVVAREETKSIIRETLIFTQADGLEVPAFLLLPKTDNPRPGVMVIAGHSPGIVATTGIFEDFHHSNGLRFAQAGYVVLAMEVRGFGYLQTLGQGEDGIDFNANVAYAQAYGKPALGTTITDAAAGLNYLQTRSEVDPEQLGVVGFSSGGKAAIYLGALDTRVKAMIASGCVSSIEANFRFSLHGPYDGVPGLGLWLDISDCLGLMAPRPVLVHWGQNDHNRKSRTAAYNYSSLPTFEAARAIFTIGGHEDQLQKWVSPQLGHEFDVEAALDFLNRHLPLPEDTALATRTGH